MVMVIAVTGIVTAQYIQNWEETDQIAGSVGVAGEKLKKLVLILPPQKIRV
jgi:hypothetical protein